MNFGEVENAGEDPFARPSGFVAGVAFGFQSARKSSDYSELAGLNDIDMSIEFGAGVGYRWPNLEVLATARYGLTGHQSLVGDVRAYYVARPGDGITVRVGPRIEWASSKYTQTYFGVTPAEARRSSFAAAASPAVFSSASAGVLVSPFISDSVP